MRLGWVAALAGLDGRGVEGATGAFKVWVDRIQLPGWTDKAVGITISLLLRPAARLGEMLAGVSAPARTARISDLCRRASGSGNGWHNA